jgi:hypothetical protein
LDTVDPVQRVVRSRRLALLRQPGEADLVEKPLRLARGAGRTVVRQRHPRRQRLLAGSHRVVVLGTELVSQSALVLPLATARDDRVDVHPVDLAGEAVAGGRVLGRTRGQQHEHDDRAELVMRQIGDAAR